ncbi:MAG TPA: hypothetical protein VHV50_03020 [Actinomycetota bacterium]|jgi:hypothetical protein|nr:hypothetical protein [Actinomycetota bacterium]
MRFKLLAAVLGIAILFASVATAAQAKKKYSTSIHYLNRSLVSPPSRDTVFSGNLRSRKRACVQLRIVSGSQNPGNGFHPFDIALSSSHGAWAVRGVVARRSQVKIVVPKQRHRHFICKRASITLPATP